MPPPESNIWASGNQDGILDFILRRLTDLLNSAEPLPSHDTYLETLRLEIWDKYKHHAIDEVQILIRNGLHGYEYALFQHLIDTIKNTKHRNKLDGKLKLIGEHAYRCRGYPTLCVFHYSFHAYVNILLHKLKNQFTERELQEIHGTSLMLERVFDGIGNWRA